VIQPGCHDTARALIGQPSTSTLFKIWVAEAYAAGHLFDLIPKEFAGYENGQVVWLQLPIKDLLPYYAFVQSHPDIYAARTSPAKVTVLYSLAASNVETPEFEREYQAVCKVLHDAHYQFDVSSRATAGANVRLPSRAGTIRGRRGHPPTTHRQGNGGNSTRLPLERPESAAMRAVQGSAAGIGGIPQQCSGETSHTRYAVLHPYLKARDPGIRERLTRELGSDPLLSTDAPATVGLVCWKTKIRPPYTC